MAKSAATFYSSSNGDRWQLVTEAETGQYSVRHVPTPSSGGQTSEVELPEFLSHAGHTPQGEALRQMLDGRGVTDLEDE